MSKATNHQAIEDFKRGVMDYVDRRPLRLGESSSYYEGQRATTIHREIELQRATDRALGAKR